MFLCGTVYFLKEDQNTVVRSSVEGPPKLFWPINLETANHCRVDQKCKNTTST